MWKIIILSILAAAQAVNIETFLGSWTPVAACPQPKAMKPMCNLFGLSRDPASTDCTCTDGKKASLVSLSLLKQGGLDVNKLLDTSPVLALDSVIDVALNVSCKCGTIDYSPRIVLRSITPNYVAMYEKKANREYTEADPYNIFIFAKEVPRNEDLLATLRGDEDLKNKTFTVVCASDISIES